MLFGVVLELSNATQQYRYSLLYQFPDSSSSNKVHPSETRVFSNYSRTWLLLCFNISKESWEQAAHDLSKLHCFVNKGVAHYEKKKCEAERKQSEREA